MGEKAYHTDEQLHNNRLRYYFESFGKLTIAKVVEYAYVLNWSGRQVFNLGFGDYDAAKNTILDDTESNNNDAYAVFNTVLYTIPAFFQKYPKAVLFVQGSDSTEEFVEKCKRSCKRNCADDVCKKKGRRIAAYTGYVNKNYEDLRNNYVFKGLLEIGTTPEDYTVGSKYEAVLVYRN